MDKDTWVIFINNYLDLYAYESIETAKKAVMDYIGENEIISKDETRSFLKYFTNNDTFKIQLIKVRG